MSWVYLPQDVASHCAPVAAGSTWGSDSPNRVSKLRALLRPTMMRPSRSLLQCWANVCPVTADMKPATGVWDWIQHTQGGAPDISGRPRCGETCEHSSAMLGAGASTRYLRATLASRSAPPDSGAAPTILATYGPTSPASFRRYDPGGSSSKTSQAIYRSVSTPFKGSFESWVSVLRLGCSQRRKSARAMIEQGCSSWGTPMAGTPAQNGNSAAGNNDFSRRTMELASELWPTPKSMTGGANSKREQRGAGGPDLQETAQAIWQTPATDSFRSRGGDRKSEMGLDQQARSLWATPASRDHKGENSADHVQTATGRAHMGQLPNQVAHAFQSPRPDPPTPTHGAMSCEWRPISRQLFRYAMSNAPATTQRRWLRKGAWRKRRLNPLFVEWLMGWPREHGLCASTATAFTRWRRLMRGELCRIPWACAPWIFEGQADTEAKTQGELF